MLKVLIDTWWNVNEIAIKVFNDSDVVLIDTWWNVNKIAIKVFNDSDVGINRYMVECEYVIEQGIIIFIVVLIDTWWNVN